MKLKEFELPGGRASLAPPPLDPPLVVKEKKTHDRVSVKLIIRTFLYNRNVSVRCGVLFTYFSPLTDHCWKF